MRRGNILEGIKAGFQAYMQGRQWASQLDTSKLQQEQMGLANEIMRQRQADYMSPEQQAEFERRNALAQQRSLWEQGRELGMPQYQTSDESFEDYQRRIGAQYEAMSKYRDAGKGTGAGAGAAGGPMTLFGKNFMDYTEVHDFFASLATAEEYESPLSPQLVEEMMAYGQAGPAGVEYARRAIWREKLLETNAHWIPPEYYESTKNGLHMLLLTGKNYEGGQEYLDSVREELKGQGVISRGGLEGIVGAAYPNERYYKAASWAKKNLPWLESLSNTLTRAGFPIRTTLPYAESLESWEARQRKGGEFNKFGAPSSGGGGGMSAAGGIPPPNATAGMAGRAANTMLPQVWGAQPPYAPNRPPISAETMRFYPPHGDLGKTLYPTPTWPFEGAGSFVNPYTRNKMTFTPPHEGLGARPPWPLEGAGYPFTPPHEQVGTPGFKKPWPLEGAQTVPFVFQESNVSPYGYGQPMYPLQETNIPPSTVERHMAQRIISERNNDWVNKLGDEQRERYIQMIISMLRDNKSEDEIQAALDAAYKRHIAYRM